MSRHEVLIAGAGPGGCAAAITLARAGVDILLLDHSHPRDKFCAGGVPQDAWRAMAHLGIDLCTRWPIDRAIIRSPRGDDLEIEKEDPAGFVVARREFDGLLLARAISAGAVHRAERVIGLERESRGFVVKTARGSYAAERIIGADGVRSVVRRSLVGRLPLEQRGFCVGAFVPLQGVQSSHSVLLDFFTESRRQGYFWIFPYQSHTSIGFGAYSHDAGFAARVFREKAGQHGFELSGLAVLGAQLPMVKDPGFYREPCAGANWALIGDAAGHVNGLTGEGIGYAARGGMLAARAVIDGDMASFDDPGSALVEEMEHQRGAGDAARHPGRQRPG